ncbi:MAG TPA: WbqC family protein [Edaphocola sp.]|nr:WbqC family protein [Edaphocola sp.]
MEHNQEIIPAREGCIAAALPFPPISWWRKVLEYGTIWLDPHEPYQKMSYRNRYYLASKQGRMMLSIPLQKGRNQHAPMRETMISFAEDWQKNHWRSLQTIMGNAPFFEFIDYQLLPFFERQDLSLYDWNKSTILWANRFLGNPLRILETESYNAISPEGMGDLRQIIHPKLLDETAPHYYQVFEDSIGFIPDCSILDLICCEGKNAINILMS